MAVTRLVKLHGEATHTTHCCMPSHTPPGAARTHPACGTPLLIPKRPLSTWKAYLGAGAGLIDGANFSRQRPVLNPQPSNLNPQASSLKPQASTPNPQAVMLEAETALETTQGQNDSFFSQLPYKCHQNRVASV